ncbi:MAG: VWA domain-containing protein [Saprospiraceae bacterium]|nr:VWA domain-containing protein [Saprospiraceae bacterium]
MPIENRWELVLGQSIDDHSIELSAEEKKIEQLLSKVYSEGKDSGFGRSTQKIRKWLEEIRTQFSPQVVSLLQKDALERQGAKEMLLEPELLEKIEPNIHLVSCILELQRLLPDKTRSVARGIVEKLVRRIEDKLKTRLIQAVRTSNKGISKSIYPNGQRIDWPKTIRRNLKNYNPELGYIIPERFYGFKSGAKLNEVFLVIDKSESMIESAIHASIIGSILASIPSICTHIIFFDTEILDVTGRYEDPIELLFSIPMGGGTDIAKALNYVDQKIRNHSSSLIFLISDLDEGGLEQELFKSIQRLIMKNSKIQCLLGLNEHGQTEYNQRIARQIVEMQVPVYTTDPENFPEILYQQLQMLNLVY